MGRSQRHMVLEQGSSVTGEAGAQGVIAMAMLVQITPDEPVGFAESPPITLTVPVGGPGGPLMGSSLTGSPPEEYLEPQPPSEPFRVIGMTPPEIPAGYPDMTVLVVGVGFEDGAVIIFDGTDMETEFLSATQLRFLCPSSTAIVGEVAVEVRNPGGAVTDPVPMSFVEEGIPDARTYPMGPFTILHIKPNDDPEGVNFVLGSDDGRQVQAGDQITVEATGNTAINGSHTVDAVEQAGGQSHVIVEDLELETQIDAKGRMTVTGGG